MGVHKSIRYKHEDGKLFKIFYDTYKGVCPKCGDDGIKTSREITLPRIKTGEKVQRYSCNACDYSGTGDKFGLSRKPLVPIKIEVIEGVGICPICGAEHVSFPSGSQKYYSFINDEVVNYKYLKCRECGYRGRRKMFEVKE